jgi:hypothetical protein
MFSQSSKHKPKPKIDPMNIDFSFMIKNHHEFFTKLSFRDHLPECPPPASGGFSRTPPLPGAFLDLTPRGSKSWQVGGLVATLKPKIFPPTLMRNGKPKKDVIIFSNNASIFLFFNF